MDDDVRLRECVGAGPVLGHSARLCRVAATGRFRVVAHSLLRAQDEWDDGASIADPDGIRPSISFLRVPEGKTAKTACTSTSRRAVVAWTPHEVRWPRVLAMADPEGNEFCVV
jgi:hypothetical protein